MRHSPHWRAGEALVSEIFSQALGATRATASVMARDLLGSRAEDPLAERDPQFIRETLPAYSRAAQLYFRPKVRGLEQIPAEGPVLLVGNHSGGTLIADTFAFAYGFYNHFGPDRLFHQLAHDLVFRVPGLAMLRRYGTIPANHENAMTALGKGARFWSIRAGTTRPTAPLGTREKSTSDIAAASSVSRLRPTCRSSPWWRSAARRPPSS